MRKYLPLIICLLSLQFLAAQIVITELSYNPPESGSDSMEYVELYNNSGADLDLINWHLTGVTDSFEVSTVLPAGGYLVLAENAGAMLNVLGVTAREWEGALGNGGETVTVYDASGAIVDEVTYDDIDTWPTEADGTDGVGASIELCDPSDNNNDGTIIPLGYYLDTWKT